MACVTHTHTLFSFPHTPITPLLPHSCTIDQPVLQGTIWKHTLSPQQTVGRLLAHWPNVPPHALRAMNKARIQR